MTHLTHRALIEAIRSCETSTEGERLLSDPGFAEVYPLVRQRLMANNLAGVKGAAQSRAQRLKGLWNIVAHEWNRPSRPDGKAEVAMLSYSTSRLFRLPAGWPDAFAHPFAEAASGMNKRMTVFEVPARGEYRRPAIGPSFSIGRDEILVRVKMALGAKDKTTHTAITDFSQLARARGLQTDGLTRDAWGRTWTAFVKRRSIFEAQFAHSPLDIAIAVTWYATTGMAFTSAAQRQGIPVADLQHGVQGAHHCMYGEWPSATSESSLIPSAFMTWSEAEHSNLSNWIGARRRSYVSGIPWMHMDEDLLGTSPEFLALKKAAGERPIILVTLQPEPSALLSKVEDLLALPGADRFSWAVRCHPGHVDQVDEIARRFAGHANVLPVHAASLAPLSLVLKLSTVHVTEFSSVVIEAAGVGIPSVLTTGYGVSHYEHLSDGMTSVETEPSSILAALVRLSSTGVENRTKTGAPIDDKTPATALARFMADAAADQFDIKRLEGADL
ncbi:hypothetical protein [Pseudooceanicola onchidii]|uniref:hypothetical protein n=1 Tax=Pseudooceanicola onchidii TaxID=2562279 RepID=UPI0010AA3609|nr:hypothetical protein [Pseudooceanicola onchidii]